MRDHGGNIDEARARYGGSPADWIDLSTGINRRPWPVPRLASAAWTDLPTRAALARLKRAAARAFGTSAAIAPLAGATAAIQLLPRILAGRTARVLGPTYNEHAASLRAAGWQVTETGEPGALAGADLAVLVNPNNPDGRQIPPEEIGRLAARVGHLVVDESFVETVPDLSLAPRLDRLENVVVLRSFGKFWGLAGLRLGFALGPAALIARVAEAAGPWPVSGPAAEIGTAALGDRAWADATRTRLAADARRLDQLATRAGWRPAGGTALFRLYDVPDAAAAQDMLAVARIWTRVFPWSDHLIRLGLPGPEDEWGRLAGALGGA